MMLLRLDKYSMDVGIRKYDLTIFYKYRNSEKFKRFKTLSNEQHSKS